MLMLLRKQFGTINLLQKADLNEKGGTVRN